MIAELGLVGVAGSAIAALWWCARELARGKSEIVAAVRAAAAADARAVDEAARANATEAAGIALRAKVDELTAKAQRLEDAYADLYAQRRSSAGLDPDDVAGRLQRRRANASATGAEADEGGGVSALAEPAVPGHAAAGGATAAARLPGDKTGV